MRVIISNTFLLVLVILLIGDTHAQRCGRAFARIAVADVEGKTVSNTTIEIIGTLSDKDYMELLQKSFPDKTYLRFLSLEIPEQVVGEMMKQSKSLWLDKDYCGNPLKLRANKTRIKTPKDNVEGGNGSKKNFGFCTSEVNFDVYLLKVSAPGYDTAYYMGRYLGGCDAEHNLVINKRKKS
jgi:hypothetical protein